MSNSKYPEVVYDKNRDTSLDMYTKISLEEKYDMMHHTHNAADILGMSDVKETIATIEENKEAIQNIGDLTQKVETLAETVNNLNNPEESTMTDEEVDSTIDDIWADEEV